MVGYEDVVNGRLSFTPRLRLMARLASMRIYSAGRTPFSYSSLHGGKFLFFLSPSPPPLSQPNISRLFIPRS